MHLDPKDNSELSPEIEFIDNTLNENVFWILVHIMHEKKWDEFFKYVKLIYYII